MSSIFWFIDPSVLQDNLTLQGSMAFSFAFLIAATSDPDSNVAQRALMYISTIKQSSLKCLCSCLEAQFDNVVSDRPLIIERFRVLSSLLPEVPVLSWDFFLNRFDVLSVEAQISLERSGKIAFPVDLFNSDPLSDTYQKKLSRARRSRESGTGGSNCGVRSISIHLNQSLRLKHGQNLKEHKPPSTGGTFGHEKRTSSSISAAISGKMKLRKVMTLVRVVHVWNGLRKRLSSSFSSLSSLVSLSRTPSPTSSERNKGHSILSSFSSKCSPPRRGSFEPSVSHAKAMREGDAESNYSLMFNKAIDVDNPQRETMALMMNLFMHFLGNPKVSLVNVDEKSAAKKQSLVLRHLNLLLGYNTPEKCFSVPPHRLR
ncbi:unnamed protein product [Soboliphyme baturini]|uniref:RICTOR_N domain-containing protein n=1 Tax=Soboliphyme baturini TaxID=241478 RepID=A0A183J6G9_9BILA|nr:unnamed protein product [Soboliphyme baturini]